MYSKFYKLSILLLFLSVYAGAQIISTYAGIGGVASYTGDGGQATDATMYSPYGLAVDDAGNLFIAERINNIIRKVDASGIITTYAGTGTAGYSGDGGPATSAQINTPYCIALDHQGNLYFTDNGNNVIRKINSSGIITTVPFYGNTLCYGPPAGLVTGIMNPTGIAVDDSNYIYFANTAWRVVMKLKSDGSTRIIAGTCALSYTGDGGPATHAALNNPIGVAVDHAGNVFIADEGNNVVRKVNPAGIISRFAGNGYAGSFYGDGGPATLAGVYGPFGVTLDTVGNLYIQDLFNRRIRKVYTSGLITTVAGNGVAAYAGDGGPALAASFYDATGFAIDRMGNYYISDLWYSVIRKVNTLTLSSEEVSAGIQMKSQAFPNPNRGVFMVRSVFSTKEEEKVDIEITNMLGQVVYTQHTKSIEGNVNEEVWLPNEPSGMYLLMVKGERESNMIKFVIEK